MRSRSRTHPFALLTVLAALTGVAACGGDDADDGTTTEATESTESTDSTEATEATGTTGEATAGTGAAIETTAETATAETATAAGTAGTAAAGPHVVVHAMGETEVPAQAERVVVLDSSFLDAAIALGVTPVGAPEGTAGRGLPAYLGDALDGIEIVGETNNPNLEVIASLQPDLIIAAKIRHEALYDVLGQIAPTVMSESSGPTGPSRCGSPPTPSAAPTRAEALLADFEARAAEVGEAIGAPGTTATIVRFLPGETRLYGPGTFSGSVLSLVGFDLGDKGYDPAYSMALISEENVDMLDSDVIFTTTLATDGSMRPGFEALWSALPAVQDGKRFDIADDVWMTGIGVLGANLILDDLERFLG